MTRSRYPFVFMLGALAAAGLSAGACTTPDTLDDEEEAEDVGNSNRGGIGVAADELVTGPASIDPLRSLAVTEQAITSQFTLTNVLNQIASQSGEPGLNATTIFTRLWNTQKPFGRVEGNQADNPSVEINNYQAIGLFNRFDLAPADGSDCGEYRVVFARTSGGGRSFIIFEAVLPNPQPNLGLEGCRPVASFWRGLSAMGNVNDRKNALVSFYFSGLSGFMPVIHAENYGINGLGRKTGQIRLNMFIQAPWMLKELRFDRTCSGSCTLSVLNSTVKTNPFGNLFTQGSLDSRAPSFQSYFPSQVASLAVNDINRFDYAVPDQYNTLQSDAQGGFFDDYTAQLTPGGTLANNIQAQLNALGSPLTPEQIVARAEALSCAGCHQVSNGTNLGGGLTWPSSAGFVHVSETLVSGSFQLSPALTNVFLPHRKRVLENFLNRGRISGGSYHSCGLRADATVACWGNNGNGQSSPPSGTFNQVAAGAWHSCGLRTDGTISCWGYNGNGQASAPFGTFTQVSTDAYSSCGLRTDKSITCWGDNSFGQSSAPFGTFTHVSTRDQHTCAVRTDATITCWGKNNSGESSPPSGDFIQVTTGGSFSCGLKRDGSAVCWGNGFAGKTSPPAGPFTQISAGWDYGCGLKQDGTIACWGSGGSGQTTVPFGTYTQVSTGEVHTCAVKSDGTVACWGLNNLGQAVPPP